MTTEDHEYQLLSDAESTKYKIELTLIKVRSQRLFSLTMLIASFMLLMTLLFSLVYSTFEVGRFEFYLPAMTLLVGFVLIQSFRYFKASCFLYSSAIVSRQRIVASIDEWERVCNAEKQL